MRALALSAVLVAALSAAVLAACSTQVAGRPAAASPALPIPTSVRTAHRAPLTLPLNLPTGDATQVVTVTAASSGDTGAVLQAWQRGDSGWQKYGPATQAWLGTDGLTDAPSELTTATPAGSFTLTQAFGAAPDPGSGLPYRQTTPDDWWISQPGPLYNTMQRCASACAFEQGAPNEHLYYELPYYEYAVVIDANTANSPTGVRQGAGSAYFLHVTVGAPTQACISIEQPALVSLLRWLRRAAHPRILIGVG